MASTKTLDLTKVTWPESLLKCKNKLDAMEPGHEFEILAKDLDVVKNLVQIIERSQCSIRKNKKNGSCYQLHIIKM